VPFTFFSSELELIELRHVELRSALLAEEWVDELRMTYRPRIDLRTMQPNGVEASAVWEHPRHGPVQLDDLAEIGGPADHLARLARAVTEQAAAELTAIGWPDDLSVNVDMSSLPWLDSSIDEWVPELIAKYHLREGQLRLQITQSQVVERAGLSVAALDALRDQGVRFTLGGFGSLESSLSALRELPVNEILIHRRLIHELELGDPTIVRTVIDLAHRLGLTAVADGIDTVEVLDRVRMLDCDSALGAMAGIPLDVDGLEAFVLAMTPVEAAAEIPLPD
jgi:EAL domain-containing protein (putative c-di-GMP-specific phosphodiesterase class I)